MLVTTRRFTCSYSFNHKTLLTMSSIKPKKGKCIDCPAGAPEKYLTAKRCEFHYRLHRNAVNANKKHNVSKKEFKADLNVFFASQTLQVPYKCEECGGDISYWKIKNPRMLIAHILPKRKNGGFPSVATHPRNRMFYCPDCHTYFDTKGASFAEQLKSLPVMRARFNEFKNELSEQDLQRVPNYLK